MIQIPRIYTIFKQTNQINNFGELLDSAASASFLFFSFVSSIDSPAVVSTLRPDIFHPLFEVTLDPTSHPELHKLLRQVTGFDSVDDESRPERQFILQYILELFVLPLVHVTSSLICSMFLCS